MHRLGDARLRPLSRRPRDAHCKRRIDLYIRRSLLNTNPSASLDRRNNRSTMAGMEDQFWGDLTMPISKAGRFAVCVALVVGFAQAALAADILIADAKSQPESLTVAPGGVL